MNMTMRESPNFRLGTATREQYYLKDKYKDSLPGPNIYNPKTDAVMKTMAKTSLGFGKKYDLALPSSKGPGPGSYALPNRAIEGPKFVMGSKLKSTLERNIDVPGPGEYQPNFNMNFKRDGSYSLGTGQRQYPPPLRKQNDFPGPGSYTTHNVDLNRTISTFSNSPKFGFGSGPQRGDLNKTV